MQEQEEKIKIPTPQIMIFMLQQLNYTAHEKEAALETEESGNKVANLQGFLAGVRAYKRALNDSGYEFDFKYNDTKERKLPFFSEDGCELQLTELREVISDIDAMTDTAAFENFKSVWQTAVDTRKDWLFYTSEKGRDLHFAKGWYEAMSTIGDTIKKLQNELKAAEKEAAESLPFGE